jgi:hypothetical protein
MANGEQPTGAVAGARWRPRAVPLVTSVPHRGSKPAPEDKRDSTPRRESTLKRWSAPEPTPTQPAPAQTPTPTPTDVPPTATNTPAPTAVVRVPSTSTPTPSATPSPAQTSPAPTATSAPASTSTPTPAPAPATATPLPPTSTPPAVAATATPPPATATATAVPPTSTPVPPPTATPASGTLNSVDRIIATRGSNLLHHEINLPSPLDTYSFGQHGTEDNKTLPRGSRSLNGWLAVHRDASQLNTALNVKVNVRNIACYVHRPSNNSWVLAETGLPTWSVSFDYSGGDGHYLDISPTREADGSYSYDIPVARGLHMSLPAPGGSVTESDGVLCTVEARLLGSDAAVARLGMAAGADFRDAAGTGGSIQQSGHGQLGLLTASWRAFDMLSSALSDAQIRQTPPPLQ